MSNKKRNRMAGDDEFKKELSDREQMRARLQTDADFRKRRLARAEEVEGASMKGLDEKVVAEVLRGDFGQEDLARYNERMNPTAPEPEAPKAEEPVKEPKKEKPVKTETNTNIVNKTPKGKKGGNSGTGGSVGGGNTQTASFDRSFTGGDVTVRGDNSGNINVDSSVNTNVNEFLNSGYSNSRFKKGEAGNNYMAAANAVMQAAQNPATAASAGKGLSYDLGDFSLKGIPNNRERMEYLKDEVAATTQDFYDRGELAAMNVFGKRGSLFQ